MRHEDRHVAIGRRGLAGKAGRIDEIGRQRDDAGQPLRMPQSGVQRDRAALRESREHDACVRHPARTFAVDQRFELRLRTAHARQVGARVQVGVADVVPRGHDVPVVDRHRHRRRVRKQEAHGERRRKARARAPLPTSRGRRRPARAARSRRHWGSAQSRFRLQAGGRSWNRVISKRNPILKRTIIYRLKVRKPRVCTVVRYEDP